MADLATILDQILVGQAQPAVTANELFDAASPATLFGRRARTCSGLTWGYYGGVLLVDGVPTAVANGTLSLTASQTNYIEATRAGSVSFNTTGYTAGRIPLYRVTTSGSAVTNYLDDRVPWQPAYITHEISVAVTTADVTLSAAQARARLIQTTGVLTGNRAVILPDRGEWIAYCNNSGAFTTTFKTSGGSGIVVAQGSRAILYGDGTNVVRVTADA